MVRGGNGIPWMPTLLTPPTPAGFMQAAQHLHEGAGNDDDQCIILATGLRGSCLLYTSPSPRDSTSS
eukprot:7362844-Prorocentrum_lima.AAC.1